MVSLSGWPDRFRAVEYASLSFLTAVEGMCRKERPPDIEHLLRLADTLLEAHEQSMLQARSGSDGEAAP